MSESPNPQRDAHAESEATADNPTGHAYERTRDLHHKIEAVYQRVEEHGARFRRTMRVDSALPAPPGSTCGAAHDPIVCSLAIKAATTKRAILTLCESGDGDNAIALTRVLLENACLLEWLIRGDGRKRLDAYVLFMSVQQVRIARLIDRFNERFDAPKGRSVSIDPFHAAVWKYTFRDTKNERPTWEFDRATGRGEPVRVNALFREITDVWDSFEYEILYGALGSDIVHSGPSSLLLIQQRLGQEFVLQPMPVRDHRMLALASSNVAMLLVLDSLTEYVGLNLTAEISALKAAAQIDPSTDTAP